MSTSLPPLIRKTAIAVLGSRVFVGRRLSQISDSRVLTVLNLHRVDDNSSSGYEALSPSLFNELLGWLKTRFHLTTFGELREDTNYRRPPLVLSFDDGYRDFIDVAVPILHKHGVRANQNVIPACIEMGRPPVNVEIQDFIGAAPAQLLKEVSLPGLPHGADPHNRIGSALVASAAVKHLPIAEQRAILANLRPQFSRFDGFKTTPVMSPEEVRQVCREHEIGVHSFEHATMTAETDEYLANDLERCKAWFSTNLKFAPSVYAFPNGAARSTQAAMVRAAGFPTVLLVHERFSRTTNWLHPRFTFYARSSAEVRFRAVGGLSSTLADQG